MDFLQPNWFLGLVPLLLYLGLALRCRVGLRLRRQTLFFAARQKGEELLPLLLIFGAGFLLLVALAEPVVYRLRPVFKRSGVDIAVGIDISKSMLAEDAAFPISSKDLSPLTNRLNRARMMVLDLLDNLQGERVGIFVFAAQSFVLVPLTSDYGYCRYLVENLDDLAISSPGSDLVTGLECGLEMLDRNLKAAAGIILFISDGEDSDNDLNALEKIAQKARRDRRKIYTLGVGSRAAGLIPIRTPDGKQVVGYYNDEAGDFLTTSMEPEKLQTMAVISNGEFRPLGREKLARIVVEKMVVDINSSGLSTVNENLPYALSPWFLFVAFTVFLVGKFTRQN
ncbi:MAG: VWA domain-containing protein [Pseudomonadota bacterium]|nr:VWA domain-containing protein [Pseudomonadota bacterium]